MSFAEGGFGKGRRPREWRAVKVVSKHRSRAKNINYVTELKAVAKFSQKYVSLESRTPLLPLSRANVGHWRSIVLDNHARKMPST